jgi:hypothetical protein
MVASFTVKDEALGQLQSRSVALNKEAVRCIRRSISPISLPMARKINFRNIFVFKGH